MNRSLPFARLALVTTCLAFVAVSARSQETTSKLEEVAARVEKLVESDFYRKVDFPMLLGDITDDTIDDALADLHVSHTRRIKPDTIDYYEVLDIYERSLQRDVRRLFSNGIQYQGIGTGHARGSRQDLCRPRFILACRRPRPAFLSATRSSR